MSSLAQSRLSTLLSHFLPSSTSFTAADNTNTSSFDHRHNYHTLSPTIFLPRAAEIEPEVSVLELKHDPSPVSTTPRRVTVPTVSAIGLAHHDSWSGLTEPL